VYVDGDVSLADAEPFQGGGSRWNRKSSARAVAPPIVWVFDRPPKQARFRVPSEPRSMPGRRERGDRLRERADEVPELLRGHGPVEVRPRRWTQELAEASSGV
jgi:hypothetical protein